MARIINALVRDERGATSIEYALIATLVSIGCIAGLMNFAESMDVLYLIVDNIAATL